MPLDINKYDKLNRYQKEETKSTTKGIHKLYLSLSLSLSHTYTRPGSHTLIHPHTTYLHPYKSEKPKLPSLIGEKKRRGEIE